MKPLIVGAGLAGLAAALRLAEAGTPVTVLTAATLEGDFSSMWAQGGIAAAVGPDDNPKLHAEDTIKAGAGLCDPETVRLVTAGAPGVIEQLEKWGVAFDRQPDGSFDLGLEGGHGKHRIVHKGGDTSGRAITCALVKRVREMPLIEVMEKAPVTSLSADNNRINGLTYLRDGQPVFLPADRVLLATGGAATLWRHTTNPPGSSGRGLALAARAGAELSDLEFMQFHPTAIDIRRDPMPLASEALRGDGCTLIDETGARFTDEMKPRDIVARAIQKHLNEGHRVFLDGRTALGEKFAHHFPVIYRACMDAGIDPTKQPIPVRPAAHYHMGGVETDLHGRTSVKGLWAAGEIASTGLQGANRLASNSLLEAVFFGMRAAEDIQKTPSRDMPMRAAEQPVPDAYRDTVREIMSKYAGMLRDREGLEQAIEKLTPLADKSDSALAGLLIAISALRREESRGGHTRRDFPGTSRDARHSIIKLSDITSNALRAAS